MRENTKSSSLFDPSSLISEDGTIIKKPFKIYPIKCGSNKYQLVIKLLIA